MTVDLKTVRELTQLLKVLYVEDDIDLRTETSLFFEHFFDDIITANDGLDALEKMEKSDFDLIISDINMPNMNGIEMAQTILKNKPDQTFIFISAHDDSGHLKQLMNLGITKFIAKPFKSNELLQTLFETAKVINENKDRQAYYDGVLDENLKNLNEDKQDKATDDKNPDDIIIPKIISVQNSILHPKRKTETANENFDLDITELEDIYEEIDALVAMKCLHPENSYSPKDRAYFSKLFSRYASILSTYQMFHEISQKIKDLSVTIDKHKAPDDLEIQAYLFTLIESFLKVLHKWQESWKDQEDDNAKLHYLDNSIINDLDTIIITWENKHKDDNDEIEFF